MKRSNLLLTSACIALGVTFTAQAQSDGGDSSDAIDAFYSSAVSAFSDKVDEKCDCEDVDSFEKCASKEEAKALKAFAYPKGPIRYIGGRKSDLRDALDEELSFAVSDCEDSLNNQPDPADPIDGEDPEDPFPTPEPEFPKN